MSEPKFVLQSPVVDDAKLPVFVEECLSAKASLIAIVGDGCADVEDQIDCLIHRDGTDSSRFITTTSHPDETLDEVMEFARLWGDERAPTTLIRL